MSPALREHYLREIAAFKSSLFKDGNRLKAWKHLERAHILGQFHVGPHLQVHGYMMSFAIRTKNWREILGQIPRLILAAPGSYFRRAPLGNTGGANVGIFQPMEIPEDLQAILKDRKE